MAASGKLKSSTAAPSCFRKPKSLHLSQNVIVDMVMADTVDVIYITLRHWYECFLSTHQ